ncbi:MAG: hypothetical protein ACRCST_01845 [Turicibacter sp.]
MGKIQMGIYLIALVLLIWLYLKQKKKHLLGIIFIAFSIIVLNIMPLAKMNEWIKVIWAVGTLLGCIISYLVIVKGEEK